MANNVELCNCIPYSNICCCGPDNGISVVQPSCQNLSDGRVVNNPSYDPLNNKSYWTYKFITDCNPSTRAISNFVIPICEVIKSGHITVFEKIDGCGKYTPVTFLLKSSDAFYGNAPLGFQWLKIEVNNRFEKGVCVEYRLEITGNYPETILPIQIKSHNSKLVFDCENCFLVPECNPQGKLVTSKSFTLNIENNQAVIRYIVEVNNLGNANLENVKYRDTLIIPTQLTVGTISITPNTLDISRNTGQIVISGNLGTLRPGGQVEVKYDIPITQITTQGTYNIENTVFTSSTGTESTATAITTLEVVKLESNKCCIVSEDGNITFRVLIENLSGSPETTINVLDNILIPAGITVQFIHFDGCMATYEGTNNEVPINTNVEGPMGINIRCNNVKIPTSGMIQKLLPIKIVSSSVPGRTVLANTIQSVNLSTPNEQIFLGAGNLPLSAIIEINLNFNCNKPCT